MGHQGRDIVMSEIDHTRLLIAACDSCGGIGDKSLDKIKVPAELVGRLTTRVAMMEIVAVGAIPKLITIAISAEPEPTGAGILLGVEAELIAAGFSDLPRSISTEKNIPTSQTGLGIGITGICNKRDFRIGRSKTNDNVYCLGQPKVGNELISANDPEIVQISNIAQLSEHAAVHDILPIGSRGILAEANQLADQANCCFVQNNHTIDLNKSAGPSTCIIFTCLEVLHESFPEALALTKIGCLVLR